MKFLSPSWLWALLALPPLLWLIFWDERRRLTQFERFADRRVWRALAPELDPRARTRKMVVWLLVVAFVLLALARPQWGSHEEVVQATGLDVMVVLDVSNSMETEDVVPSRIKKARHLVRSLSERIQGDRMGIVAFAGSSYVACPLTTDMDYLNEVLQYTSPRIVSSQGTDIGLGLETALKSIDRGAEEAAAAPSGSSEKAAAPQPSHVVLLISDGEDQEEGAVSAAKLLKDRGVKLYVIGVGTEKGAPIPLRDGNGNLTGYKKDRSGQPIVSKFHPDALMQVAQAAGGRYFNATSEESEVDEMLRDMGALDRTDYAERRYLVYEDRFQFPLAVAILLLLFQISLPIRKMRGAAGLAVFLLIWATPQAHASSLDAYLENEKGIQALKEGKAEEAQRKFGTAQALNPELPELQYNQGVVQLQNGDVESAVREFSGASQKALEQGNSKLASKSLYNLGETLQKKGDTRGAAQAYLGAIEASKQAKDEKLEAQARKNLELLESQRQQQKQQKQQQDQQKQQQDQQDKKDQQDQKDQKDQQQKQDQQGQQDKKNQQQDKQDKKDKKDKKDQQDQKDKQDKKDQQDQQGQQDQKDKQYKDPSQTRKQQAFQSKSLTKEDAERVLNELNNRERDLQAKLKKQHGTPQSQKNTKDW